MNTRVYLIRRTVKLPGGGKATYWVLKWPNTVGKMQSESIGKVGQMTSAEAKDARDQKANDLGCGKALRDKPRKTTLADFLRLDRAALRTTKQSSTINQQRIASDHALSVLGPDIDPARVRPDDVTRIQNWLDAPHKMNSKTYKPASKATIRKTIVTLKAAWNRGIAAEKLTKNPFASVKLAKVQPKQMRIFTRIEADAMVEAAPSAWWQAMIFIGFRTGLRLGELLNLTWEDVNLSANTLTVSAKRAGKFTVAKHGEFPILEWSAKDKEARTVSLPPGCEEHMEWMKLVGGGSAYVFLSLPRLRALQARQQAGRMPEPAQWVNNLPRDFGRIQEAARAIIAKQRGVAIDEVTWRRGTMHDLRKSFGTHMAKVVQMHELQYLMGHSKITTTAEFYTAVDRDLSAKVAHVFSAAG